MCTRDKKNLGTVLRAGRVGVLVLAVVGLVGLPRTLWGQGKETAIEGLRVGMIGLDTSHAPAFTKLINADDAQGTLAKIRVVAAFPGGSRDLPSSRDRVEGYTQQMQAMGVEIVDSIPDLLQRVDAVLLESVDGRVHLEQVLPVFRSGKPVFIDKPLAADLVDALAIEMAAEKYHARWFSSSSLRFSPSIERFRSDAALASSVRGAISWSPCSLDPTHTDLTWYGIHGMETLYTAMGPGCTHVSRVHTEGADVVTGIWKDGRVGTYRGIRDGKTGYGLIVFTEKQIFTDSRYEGYGPLVVKIADFFWGEEPPVSPQETIEMFAVMQAAEESKERHGALIAVDDVLQRARDAARKRLAQLDP
ncbi:MAG: oxidoreductase [Pirellulaceae bacterium]|nr:MAG: oxidoreductase [Pirellulaceae bacterium]